MYTNIIYSRNSKYLKAFIRVAIDRLKIQSIKKIELEFCTLAFYKEKAVTKKVFGPRIAVENTRNIQKLGP